MEREGSWSTCCWTADEEFLSVKHLEEMQPAAGHLHEMRQGIILHLFLVFPVGV